LPPIIAEMLLGKRDLNSVLAELEKLLETDGEAEEDNFQLSMLGLLFNVRSIYKSSCVEWLAQRFS